MPKKALERIEKAEEEARKLVQEGQEEIERMLVQSQNGRRNLLAQSLEEATKKGEDIRRKLLDEAEKEIDQIRKDFAAQRKTIQDTSGTKLNDVVQLIVEKAKAFWIEPQPAS